MQRSIEQGSNGGIAGELCQARRVAQELVHVDAEVAPAVMRDAEVEQRTQHSGAQRAAEAAREDDRGGGAGAGTGFWLLAEPARKRPMAARAGARACTRRVGVAFTSAPQAVEATQSETARGASFMNTIEGADFIHR